MKLLFILLFATTLVFPQNAIYIASKHSDKYHLPHCRSAKRISDYNIVKFKSIQEAESKGYIPCKICKPRN